MEDSLIGRAFELAGSGRYRSLEALDRGLKAAGEYGLENHLRCSPLLRRQLRGIIQGAEDVPLRRLSAECSIAG